MSKRYLMSAIALTAIFLLGAAPMAFGQPSFSDLEGEYVLDRSQSEDSRRILEAVADREGASDGEIRDLENKLEAPETIRLGISGQRVTLETSNSSNPAVFVADGMTRKSQRADGSYVSVRATLSANRLTIASLGGESDFTLIFESIDDGNALRVTRRITTDYLSQTVFAESVYVRDGGTYASTLPGTDRSDSDDEVYSSSDSDDQVYSSSDPNDIPGIDPVSRPNSNGIFVVPSGTSLTGVLNNKITTKASQDNDRFTLTVDTPGEFEGAEIGGYISGVKRTGRLSGRSRIAFNFDTITMRDGRTYEFAGVLKGIYDADGESVKISDEGEAKSGSRTGETAKRSGIGAGLGAIIGGILGGGKGAIIGATIGAGAGAGSVIVEGKDDLVLDPGSKMTIESTSPRR